MILVMHLHHYFHTSDYNLKPLIFIEKHREVIGLDTDTPLRVVFGAVRDGCQGQRKRDMPIPLKKRHFGASVLERGSRLE
jgi:hypothetical protein